MATTETRAAQTRTGMESGRSSRRGLELLVYLGLVIAALAPGVLARAGLEGDVLAPLLKPVSEELRRISFGHGWRFWMGVGGASAMAMLLIYPLRKLIGLGSLLSVAAWFRLHIVLGLAGPLLILYHCNFGLGSTPANVALFTALAVAASGLVGYFVHQRSNARFYDEAAETRSAAEKVRAEVAGWKDETTRDRFLAELGGLHRPIAGEKRTIFSGMVALQRLRQRRRLLLQIGYAIIGRETPSAAERRARMIHFRGALAAYASVLRRSTRASIVERLLAGWRMLHMPLFAVTVAAAAIHVGKVWDIDVPNEEPGIFQPVKVAEATSAPAIVPPKPALVRETIATNPSTVAVATQKPAPVTVVQPPRAQKPAPAPTLAPAQAPAPASRQVVAVVPTPPAPPPTSLPKETKTEPTLTRSSEAAEPEVAPSRLGMPIEPEAKKTATSPAPRPAPPATLLQIKDDPVERLRSLMAAETRGQFEPSALAIRLGALKNANFDHSKTMFPLTGKHATLLCESCHKTTLKDTPRDCIACHREDDIHRGRRPDCARCHVTSDWSTIKRRK